MEARNEFRNKNKKQFQKIEAKTSCIAGADANLNLI